MNVNKELLRLDKEQKVLEEKMSNLLVKYGKKFEAYYNTLINRVARANQNIDRLEQDKIDMNKEMETLRTALAYTETEV
jgi:uncharacterized protein YlxW (UPF0749 family)